VGVEFQTLAWDERLATLILPAIGTQISPAASRDLALTIARRGIGRVSPNPLVGAVIVDAQHRFVAAGAHEHVGQAHGEIQAIAAARAVGAEQRCRGGTLYVTLEPCAHVGRTPACAPAVADAGFATVVFGMVDPNPKVNGRGAAVLRERGVDARHDQTWQRECEALAEVFVWNMRHEAPFVALKAAAGLDGVIARRGDRRVFITGERARAYGHYLRIVYDGIVIGANTLTLDNPDLTPRQALVAGRVPWRIVVDPDAAALQRVGLDNVQLLKREPEKVVWVTGQTAAAAHTGLKSKLEATGAHWLAMPQVAPEQIAAEDILAGLHELGLRSILLEGGAGLYSGFLNDGLVNRLHLFQTPKIFGGDDAIRMSDGALRLDRATLDDAQVTALGDDWVVEARFSDFNRGHA
jgi:diaminohydroxyphosphoribosylaminopyrimidine deaminase/5-amino-6-(5-phosphoribosylamino)uracil reductase